MSTGASMRNLPPGAVSCRRSCGGFYLKIGTRWVCYQCSHEDYDRLDFKREIFTTTYDGPRKLYEAFDWRYSFVAGHQRHYIALTYRMPKRGPRSDRLYADVIEVTKWPKMPISLSTAVGKVSGAFYRQTGFTLRGLRGYLEPESTTRSPGS